MKPTIQKYLGMLNYRAATDIIGIAASHVDKLTENNRVLEDTLDASENMRGELEEEVKLANDLIQRQSDLLTGVANALLGHPDGLSLHSHHDLPERVQALRETAIMYKDADLRYAEPYEEGYATAMQDILELLGESDE